ncbi:MAG: phospho-N-acetylmuramoyl-pentapeptide-transferase [Bacteroidales bacterium]|nr:phospho-N-acetylmuramoyl-pentapeptide-transferase [Bacteroidales bacterium]OQC46759.1 MAG: Phospho-N-acetylmuramoyl-pentapeptide-transferase [Bacteroidetes bacterium ADurb.Bin028]HNY43464.1 phospho-N-acetylmuramoyl-pentapeptide-transferase [Bacteroidales bacterium]
MLYYLFSYLQELDVPGAGVFEYITFRAAMATITSLIVSIFFGKKIIRLLQKRQIGEEIRDLGLEDQMKKKGTPTMGGLIIIAAIIIPTLLFAKLDNIYVLLMLITTVWLGTIGFLDDYLKIKNKNKVGLKGKYKIIGQIALGFIVGGILYFSDDVVIRTKVCGTTNQEVVEVVDNQNCSEFVEYVDVKSTKTTIPFFKNNEFDYAMLVWFLGENAEKVAWLVFIIVTILIVTAVSNGANLTDGLDGLATGSSAIIGATLGILAYVSGNRIAAEYLNILYIPNTGELVIFMAAFIGATIGFLWYNSFPAQIFMGDTGSLTIGGIIAVFAIIIKKELLIPILCGVFLAESLSVMIQVSYFKFTKRKYGEGRRVFLMAPLHHHYQKKGFPEPKIVTRFWIISLILAVISIITLKLR